MTEFVTQDYELSARLLEILSLRTSNYMHKPILLLILTVICCSDIVGFHVLFVTFCSDLCIVTVGAIFLTVAPGCLYSSFNFVTWHRSRTAPVPVLAPPLPRLQPIKSVPWVPWVPWCMRILV